jgi:hypothetical protein
MTTTNTTSSEKIINTNLLRIGSHGAFKAYVRLAQPEKPPACMQVMELHSPGLLTVRIPCDMLNDAADDSNVLSIELCEHDTLN